ncbi:MAG: uroporphyrinogen-III synthase, partial [Abditibacteriaceae bacterium]
MTESSSNFKGAKVLTFAGRRSADMGRLIEKHGGIPVLAPVLREVPLEKPPEIDTVLQALKSDEPTWLILLTGVGAKVLLERLEKQLGREQILKVLSHVSVLVRGPKPAHALRQWGWTEFLTVPEPNTWHELLEVLDATKLPVKNSTAIVQEFGAPHPTLVNALEARGAKVLSVPAYRWAMPDDLEPARAAISDVIGGKIDVVLWTASAQIHHVFAIAEAMNCTERLHDALAKTMIGSIGPTTSAALREYGLEATLEPQHPKMGHLIKACAVRS